MAKRLHFGDYYYLQGNNVHIHGVGSLKVPTGNTEQQPVIMTGAVRFNTETNTWVFGDNNNNLIKLSNNVDEESTFYPMNGGLLRGSLMMASSSGHQVLAAHGSSSRPSFTFNGDVDTGIYRSSEDVIDIVVGGDFNSTNPVMRLLRDSTSVPATQAVEINGNLTVKGTMTTINSADLEISDNTIRLNKNGSRTGNSGIEIEGNGTVAGRLVYDFVRDRWVTDGDLISDMPLPVLNGDLTNKEYVDGEIDALDTNLSNGITNSYNTLDDKIDAEITRATDRENAIAGDLSNEVTRATGEEQRIEGKIDDIVVSSGNEVSALDDKIDAEITRATNRENAIAGDLSNEVTRATGEEQRIEGKIDDLVVGSGNEVSALDDKIDAEITRATNRENSIDQALTNEVTRATGVESDLQQQINTKQNSLGFVPENSTNKGQSSGYASLDSSGKVPSSELPSSVFGGIIYKGAWNALTNTPTLQSGIGTRGEYYKVSVASDDTSQNTTLDGVNDWATGDILLYNGGFWEKFDQTDKVTSVKGISNSLAKVGDVVLDIQDVGASSFGATLVAAVDAQDARNTLGLGDSATYNIGDAEGDIPVRISGGDLSGDLVGNATTASRLENTRSLVFDGDVDGTGTFDGSTDTTITLNVNNDSHTHEWNNVTSKPIGEKGQVYYFSDDGTSVEGSNILHNLRIVDTPTRLQDEKQSVPSFQDVFNNWYRFSHGNGDQVPYAKSETNEWVYNTSTDTVECTVNSGTHIGFVSDVGYDHYVHEATLSSSDSDNDMLGVVIAFDVDEENMVTNTAFGDDPSLYSWDINTTDQQVPSENTLTVIRTRSTESHLRAGGVGLQYGVVYNYGKPDAKLIANGDAMIDTVTGVFNGVESRVRVVRNGDIITVTTTEWSDSTSYDGTFKGQIVVDLTTDSVLENFRGKKPYGYSSLSQPLSTYKDILFTDPSGKIYDVGTNTSWYHDGTQWVQDSSNVQVDIGSGRLVRNPDYNDIYYIESDNTVTKIYEYNNSGNYYTKAEIDSFISARKWGTEATIAVGASEVVNLGTIFGSVLTDVRNCIIDIKVLDNVSGSSTNGLWIDATAVCTYGIDTTSNTLNITNEYNTSLAFYISVHI